MSSISCDNSVSERKRIFGRARGRSFQPAHGESLPPLLQNKSWERAQPIFFKHEGNCAIQHGQFKLVREFGKSLQLYDTEVDRTWLNNLMGRHKPLEKDLLKQFNDWAKVSGVMDWNIALPRLLKAWELESAER